MRLLTPPEWRLERAAGALGVYCPRLSSCLLNLNTAYQYHRALEEDYMPFRKVLRADLNSARKAKDSELVAFIRTLIAAIENAEAVEPSDALDGHSEVARRSLSDDDILRIVLAEGAELRTAADDYERHGNCTEAERLRALALVADRYADEIPAGHT